MPQYHPNEHPGLLQHETPLDLGPRAELLAEKHVEYLIAFGKARSACARACCARTPAAVRPTTHHGCLER